DRLLLLWRHVRFRVRLREHPAAAAAARAGRGAWRHRGQARTVRRRARAAAAARERAHSENGRLADVAVRLRSRLGRRCGRLGLGRFGLGLVRLARVGAAVHQLVDDGLRGVVDLDELDAHAGRAIARSLNGVALPHDAAHAHDDGLIARQTDLELEERPRRKRAAGLDVDAPAAHVMRMIFDELVDRRALVTDVQADDLDAAIFASVL